jgi:anti-sigma factor RsiW
MSMVDESTIELINAEVDGRLASDQRSELSRRLLVDEDARTLQREMSDLRDLLATLPPAEVPGDMAPTIIAALPAAAADGTSGRRHFGRRGAWTYFGAMAAAVALVSLALQLQPDVKGLETAATVGTMASGPLPRSFAIDDPAIRGTVTPRVAGRALVLDFDVSLLQKVAIVAVGGGTPLARVEQEPGSRQSLHFSMELPDATSVAGPIVLRVWAGDRLVDEVQLVAPDS